MRTILTVVADPHSAKTQLADGTYLVQFPYPEQTIRRAVVPEPYQASHSDHIWCRTGPGVGYPLYPFELPSPHYAPTRVPFHPNMERVRP